MSTLLVESLGTAEAASEALGLEVESVPVIQAVDLNAPTNIDGSSSAPTAPELLEDGRWSRENS